MLQDSWQKVSRSATYPAGSGTDGSVAVLPDLSVLRFTGSDVLSFLQGYLTVDTRDLPGAGSRLTALTNLQGRVVANGWCASPHPDVVDWIVHHSLTGHVAKFLQRYLAFSRTTLEVRTDDHLVVGVLDPDAAPGAQVLNDEPTLTALLGTHTVVDAARWHECRIDARIALLGQSTSEAFLPQMLGLVDAGAVDFDKGCYLGQEVVARAQHRGEVKRGLARLAAPLPLLPAGAALTDTGGRPAGTLIDAAAVGPEQHCLAVVRLPTAPEYRANGIVLTAY